MFPTPWISWDRKHACGWTGTVDMCYGLCGTSQQTAFWKIDGHSKIDTSFKMVSFFRLSSAFLLWSLWRRAMSRLLTFCSATFVLIISAWIHRRLYCLPWFMFSFRTYNGSMSSLFGIRALDKTSIIVRLDMLQFWPTVGDTVFSSPSDLCSKN